MPSVLRHMNVISRCAAAYKNERCQISDIAECHHVFFFRICNQPGLSQDALVKHTRLNKSTVTRTLAYLEERGFIKRVQDEQDKRSQRVYPTEKMLSAFPKIRALAREWNDALTDGISDEEMKIFEAVLGKMEERAVILAFGKHEEDKL